MSAPQRLSGPFAAVSGLLMCLFCIVGFRFVSGYRYLYIVLSWASVASLMMVYWGAQAWKKYERGPSSEVEPGIGQPTLEMIGGVSAAVIASVTLVILLVSSDRAAKDQSRISCAQLTPTQRSTHPAAADACAGAEKK